MPRGIPRCFVLRRILGDGDVEAATLAEGAEKNQGGEKLEKLKPWSHGSHGSHGDWKTDWHRMMIWWYLMGQKKGQPDILAKKRRDVPMSCQDLKAKLVQCNLSVRALEDVGTWSTGPGLWQIWWTFWHRKTCCSHLAQGIEAIGLSCLDGVVCETGCQSLQDLQWCSSALEIQNNGSSRNLALEFEAFVATWLLQLSSDA